ncbi:CoA ester lyase [Alpinimonas psychrophila]|uniref:Citrate lyase subunit beta/citryl-CoA lyase n=1 Tax=Alpinimonas psychrophila TaxID=748908 RepID=A0A7W3JV94_9MICO|nr:citrate lyase subunit beta/citryl-CoA lyase [Alpinimonas psychrophila]
MTTSAIALVAHAVSALFVPGDRPERFLKAQGSGADIVILDLEDAVSTENKAAALAEVLAALTPSGTPTPATTAVGPRLNAMVRISGADSSDEITALAKVAAASGHGLLGIMVPKAESAAQIASVLKMLPTGLACIPLIESAMGLVNATEIARVDGVTRLAFGAVDFGLDIDATHAGVFDYARAQLVIASAAAGIAAPLDSPCVNFTDLQVVSAEALRAREFGCGGKLCIHPSQISAVRISFLPTAEQIAWAHKVVELEGGAAAFEGAMIDRPVVERAKKILAVTQGAASATAEEKTP